MKKVLAIMYLLLLVVAGMGLVLLYLNIFSAAVAAVLLVLVILYCKWWYELRTRVFQLDSNHPAAYWAWDDIKMLFKNPFPNDKRTSYYLRWMRVILGMMIIFVLILLLR